MSEEKSAPPGPGPTVPLNRRTQLSLEVLAGRIQVAQGPDAGRSVACGSRAIRIGTGADADLVLTDPSVSRAHAVVSPTPRGYVIEDLGSTNGTEVDGVSVTSALLHDGCTIRTGETTLSFMSSTSRVPCPVSRSTRIAGMVGESRPMRQVMGFLEQVAPTDATVILTGETGVGKEVAARAIHELSARRSAPLVVVDCANVQRDLLGSELFGHARGAFTGAVAAHRGAFERAHGGTLLLDEVGELPADVQARLLGVLQRREVQPLGSEAPRPVDVRVLAATHRDLQAMVAAGTFREDLYFRLAVFTVEIPPLRDRPEDTPLIAEHILASLVPPGTRVPRLLPAAVAALRARMWKGNVRELHNTMQRARVLAGAGDIGPEHLSSGVVGRDDEPDLTLESAERRLIREALARHDGHRLRAATELGISLSTLKRRVREYGLAGDDDER